jgi:hypothetical protein
MATHMEDRCEIFGGHGGGRHPLEQKPEGQQ